MPGWLALLGGVLAVAASIAAAVAVVRANLASATIAVYKEDNEALHRRVDTLSHEKADMVSQLAKCEGRVTALESEKALLTDMVTGRSAIEHLERTVIDQHASVLEGFDKVVEAIAVFSATGQLRNPRGGSA